MLTWRKAACCCAVAVFATVLLVLVSRRGEPDRLWLTEPPAEKPLAGDPPAGEPLAAEPLAGDGPQSYAANLSKLTSAVERLEKFMPLAWVHIPKCGGILMNTMMHLPGACPSLPKEWVLCSAENPDCEGFSPLEKWDGFTLTPDNPKSVVPKICPGIQRWVEHNGLNEQYLHRVKGHAAIMLRQPEQRIISGYYNPGDHHGWRFEWGIPHSIREYALVVQGTGVKMMVRETPFWSYGFPFWSGPPSWPETRLAVRRLREGFAFVGIFEEFVLSVCLMHKMFGNSCRREEFGTFHAGTRHKMQGSNGLYPVQALDGFKDEYDGALYREGLKIFRESLHYFNVSKQSCGECYEADRQAREMRDADKKKR